MYSNILKVELKPVSLPAGYLDCNVIAKKPNTSVNWIQDVHSGLRTVVKTIFVDDTPERAVMRMMESTSV